MQVAAACARRLKVPPAVSGLPGILPGPRSGRASVVLLPRIDAPSHTHHVVEEGMPPKDSLCSVGGGSSFKGDMELLQGLPSFGIYSNISDNNVLVKGSVCVGDLDYGALQYVLNIYSQKFKSSKHMTPGAGPTFVQLLDQKKPFMKRELIAEPTELIKRHAKDDNKNFLVPRLWPPHGEEAMLAVAARARRLMFPVTSGLASICAGPLIGCTSGAKGVSPRLGSMPSSLQFVRSFSNGPKLPSGSNDPSEPIEKGTHKYLTSCSDEAVTVSDISGCTSLADIFNNEPDVCLYNHESRFGKHCFSNFSIDIFKVLVTISYIHVGDSKRRFHFDPTEILIRRCEQVLLNVLVPESQLCKDTDDEATKSIYVDNIAGPFASMVYALHLRWVNTVHAKQDTSYWEISDLLESSMKGKWWKSLDDLLEHPLFWELEKKYVSVTYCCMWMTKSQKDTWQGIRGFNVKELAANFFYLKEYIVTKTALGEYHVKSVKNLSKTGKHSKAWKQEYIGAGTLGAGYSRFGNRKGDGKHADAEALVRHMLVHFDDDNFAVIPSKLYKPTVKNGFIEAERTFYIALSVYHMLKKMNLPTNILDIEF